MGRGFFLILIFFLPLPKFLREIKLLTNLVKNCGGFIEKKEDASFLVKTPYTH